MLALWALQKGPSFPELALHTQSRLFPQRGLTPSSPLAETHMPPSGRLPHHCRPLVSGTSQQLCARALRTCRSVTVAVSPVCRGVCGLPLPSCAFCISRVSLSSNTSLFTVSPGGAHTVPLQLWGALPVPSETCGPFPLVTAAGIPSSHISPPIGSPF